MSRKCAITGKSRQNGNRVSHAKNRTKHVFHANIQFKRLFIPSLGKFVRLPLSTNAIRTLDKLGVEGTLKKFKVDLSQYA